MHNRKARAAVPGMRQETQFTCCATSIAACLQAHGKDQTEADVNKILGASPMSGASWEAILATLQYFGLRGSLVVPATVTMLKQWTDAGTPVIIAWNPEGRPWSHASVVADVTDGPDGRYVHVMDSNIPNPDKTFRILHEDEFCAKWGEKVSDSLIVRRPACAVEREITVEGRQVRASKQAGLLDFFRKKKPSFEDSVKGKKFKNPDTGNEVLFDSLPASEQKKIRSKWEDADKGEGKDNKSKENPTFEWKTNSNVVLNQSLVDNFTEKFKRMIRPSSNGKSFSFNRYDFKQYGDKWYVSWDREPGAQGEFAKMLRSLGGEETKSKYASVGRVLARKAGLENGIVDRKTIQFANDAMRRKGLDGNGRFEKPTRGYTLALDILGDFGIELGEVVSSHLFNRESGSLNVDLAFTNPADSFSPMQISNTMLHLQYTRLDDARYEVLAYLT